MNCFYVVAQSCVSIVVILCFSFVWLRYFWLLRGESINWPFLSAGCHFVSLNRLAICFFLSLPRESSLVALSGLIGESVNCPEASGCFCFFVFSVFRLFQEFGDSE